jgi:hypothetical protein
MKLFMSYTALVGGLIKGSIAPEDLATGIFAFNCARKHVFDDLDVTIEGDRGASRSTPASEIWWFTQDRALAEQVHRQVCGAVQAAEVDGRCLWRQEIEAKAEAELGYYSERASTEKRVEALNTIFSKLGLGECGFEEGQSFAVGLRDHLPTGVEYVGY